MVYSSIYASSYIELYASSYIELYLEGIRLIPKLPSNKVTVSWASQVHGWIKFDCTLEFICMHSESLNIIQGSISDILGRPS